MHLNELITLIRNTLLAVHPRVWLERAPVDAVYPYLLFRLTNSKVVEGGEDFILDVMAHDTSDDATALDQLADDAAAALDRLSHRGTSLAARFYRLGRKMVEDENKPDLRCRELRFKVKVQFITGA